MCCLSLAKREGFYLFLFSPVRLAPPRAWPLPLGAALVVLAFPELVRCFLAGASSSLNLPRFLSAAKRKLAVRYLPTNKGRGGHPTQFGFPFKFIPIISLIALFILIFVIVLIVLNFLLHLRVIISRPFILHNQVRYANLYYILL